ncbi:hypothetical protein CBOM_06459 [Ceraceosorus bombacis]|uniref:Uncharacterized protein n=1 Tax=Ceraceosorus bombacis TaxID=401625 RepID=A0A0P1BJF6_9BASI|nr:hypothetical protein CBOM_06459 [Ceraceosorus bombacis]
MASYSEQQIEELFRSATHQRLASVTATLLGAMSQHSVDQSSPNIAAGSSSRTAAGLTGLLKGLQDLAAQAETKGLVSSAAGAEGQLLSSFLQPALIAQTFEALLGKRPDGVFAHQLPEMYEAASALRLAVGLAETHAPELAETVSLLVHRACGHDLGGQPTAAAGTPWKLDSRLSAEAVCSLTSYFADMDSSTLLTPTFRDGKAMYCSRRDACISIIRAVDDGPINLNHALRLASVDSDRFIRQSSRSATQNEEEEMSGEFPASVVGSPISMVADPATEGNTSSETSARHDASMIVEQRAESASEARFEATMHSFLVRLNISLGKPDAAIKRLFTFSRWCGRVVRKDQSVVFKHLADRIVRIRLAQSGPEAACSTLQQLSRLSFGNLPALAWGTTATQTYLVTQGAHQDWLPTLLEDATKLSDAALERIVRKLMHLRGNTLGPPRIPFHMVIDFLSVVNSRLLGRKFVIDRLGRSMGFWDALDDDFVVSDLSELQQVAVLKLVSAARKLEVLQRLWHRWAGEGPVLDEYLQGQKYEALKQEQSAVSRSSSCMSAMVKALTDHTLHETSQDDIARIERLALAKTIIGRFRGANRRETLGHRDLTALGDASFRVGDRKNALAAFRSILHRDGMPSSYDLAAIIGSLAVLDLDYACALLQKTIARPDAMHLTHSERKQLVGEDIVLGGQPSLHAYEAVLTQIVEQVRPDLAADLVEKALGNGIEPHLSVQAVCEVKLLLASTEHQDTGNRKSLNQLPRLVQHAINVGWRPNRRTIAALIQRTATIPAGGLHRSSPGNNQPRERQREPAGANAMAAEQLLHIAATHRLMDVQMATLVVRAIGSAANHLFSKSAEKTSRYVQQERRRLLRAALDRVVALLRRLLRAALDRVVALLRWAPTPPNQRLLRNLHEAGDTSARDSPNLLEDFKAYRNIINVYLKLDDPQGAVEVMSWVRDENGLSIDIRKNSRFIQRLIEHIKNSKQLVGDASSGVIQERLLAELAGDVPTRKTKSWWNRARILARLQGVDERSELLENNRAYALYPPSDRPLRTMPGSTPPIL